MSARAFPISLLAVAAIAVGLTADGGGDPYSIRMELPNASGLRNGAQVAIGGVGVGRVELRVADGRRSVIAELEIDEEHAPLDREVRVAISAVNLLGQKRVDLLPPRAPTAPAPDGFTLPTTRVAVSADLDQVLDVLDPDTRTALAVVINEAGAGFTGRRADLAQIVGALPRSLARATELVEQVVSDNRTLGRVVEQSDGFISEVVARRRELTRLVSVLSGTAETTAARRAELRQALRRAPTTLATLRAFLGDLKSTAVSLGPAARQISAATPSLRSTLDEVSPFQRDAKPALREARAVASRLSDLARRGGPVVHRAIDPVQALADTSKKLIPVSATLDDSADNILAVLENWSRAIQFRDGLSHVFRGEATFTADTLTSAIDRLTAKPGASGKGPTRKRTDRRAPAPAPARAPVGPAERPQAPKPSTPPVLDAFTDVLKSVLGRNQGDPPPTQDSTSSSLLDFLLGS